MSLPLRITFADKDFVFYVLTKGISKDTKEITINLDGKDILLKSSEKDGWQASDTDLGSNEELVQAIGRAIRLRYRI